MSDFHLQIRDHGSETETVLREAGGVERLRSRVSVDLSQLRLVAADIRRVLARACSHGGGNQEDYDDFQRLVDVFTQGVVADDMVHELATLQDCPIALELDASLSSFPWELLKVAGQCLCVRNAVSRIAAASVNSATGIKERATRSVKAAIVVNPEFNLPAATREGDAIRTVLTGASCVDQVRVWSHNTTSDSLREALATSDWLHFAGHARTDQGRTAWQTSDGQFGATEILTARTASWPQFIFAHACASAGDDVGASDDEQPEETLAEAFLSVGVRHYLGTVVSVLDEQCRRSTETFYQQILAGETIATSLRRTRQDLITQLGPCNLLWACYILYGGPTERLLPTANSDFSAGQADISHDGFTAHLVSGDLVLPVDCEVCGRQIRTRHGIAPMNDRLVCRKCARHMTAATVSENSESIFGEELEVEAAQSRKRELRFLQRFDQSAQQFRELFDPVTGERRSVRLELVSSDRTEDTQDGLHVRRSMEAESLRPLNESRRYRLSVPRLGRRPELQDVVVRVFCRDGEFTSQRVEVNPVNRKELITLLDELRESDSEYKARVLASVTGWTDEARDLVRTIRDADAHDSKTAIVLIDLVDNSTVWCADDVRLIPLAALFDLEDDSEKVSRIIQHIRSGLPLETSLGAAQTAVELGMPVNLVETAFRTLAADDTLLLDADSEFGLVLSQARIQWKNT